MAAWLPFNVRQAQSDRRAGLRPTMTYDKLDRLTRKDSPRPDGTLDRVTNTYDQVRGGYTTSAR